MLTPREKSPPLENYSSEEDRTHDAASSSDREPNTLPTSYYSPTNWNVLCLSKIQLCKCSFTSHPVRGGAAKVSEQVDSFSPLINVMSSLY